MNKFLLSLLLFVVTLPFCAYSQSPYHAYYGNLHSHTGDSDGEGDPSTAFAYARDSAHLDFFAVTDHVEQVDILEWWDLKSEANSYTVNGTYIALAGYEWGSPLYGHCNQFNVADLLLEVGWFYTDWDGFRQWIIDNYPSFGEFNHPGEEVYFTNWDNFAYQGAASDSVFPLMEFQSIQQATDWYEEALKKGWHLSPAWNQDNHSSDWGTKNDCRTGIWATSLTKTALFDAIRKRRTFATMDKNASVWLDISGTSMGYVVQRAYNMPVHINLADDNNESWANVELVSQNGVITSFSSISCPLDTTIYLTPFTEDWIFIRVTQADADMLWSAPVHFTGTLVGTANERLPEKDPVIYADPSNNNIVVVELTGKNDISAPSHIEVITMQGQIIRNIEITNYTTYIDLSSLAGGAYIIRVITAKGIFVRKIVK